MRLILKNVCEFNKHHLINIIIEHKHLFDAVNKLKFDKLNTDY